MNFIISAKTDIGTTKDTNQDSLSVRVLNTPAGRMVFAVICDGMGGLSSGEVASASVVKAFMNWSETELPQLVSSEIKESIIKAQWTSILKTQNEKIMNYGKQQGLQKGLGTTAVTMLLTEKRYFILNVGDSRAYEIYDNVRQITIDQTVAEREVGLGRMTKEQAKHDFRRNVLLQCIGASAVVVPDMFFGETKESAVYMLCTDGFRHEITKDEIWERLNPYVLTGTKVMDNNARYLIELNKQRLEKDNISVALIRTFND